MFNSNQKSLAQQEAESKSKSFFEVADRNVSLPFQAMILSHLFNMLVIIATFYYLPIGMVAKLFVGMSAVALLIQLERGRNQALQDFHKGEVILHDKKIPSSILDVAEALVDTSRLAKKKLYFFVGFDLTLTLGCWFYTAYFEASEARDAFVAAKGKVASSHLSAVTKAIEGGYGKKTMDMIGSAATKADASITVNYLPIVVTLVVAVMVVFLCQSFCYFCVEWYTDSKYQNEKKKFTTPSSTQQTLAQQTLRRVA